MQAAGIGGGVAGPGQQYRAIAVGRSKRHHAAGWEGCLAGGWPLTHLERGSAGSIPAPEPRAHHSRQCCILAKAMGHAVASAVDLGAAVARQGGGGGGRGMRLGRRRGLEGAGESREDGGMRRGQGKGKRGRGGEQQTS